MTEKLLTAKGAKKGREGPEEGSEQNENAGATR
jgi:hypothetical protein